MGKLIDETGKRYGKLFVVSQGESHKTARASKAYWVCRCDCGKVVYTRGEHLRKGKARSCGCGILESNKQRVLPDEEAGKRRAIRGIRNDAEKRSIKWCLSDEQAKSIIKRNCHYCKRPPSNISKSRCGQYVYSGIDRIDSSKDYTIDNVVPCCAICNRSKSDLPLENFIEWIREVYNYTLSAL